MVGRVPALPVDPVLATEGIDVRWLLTNPPDPMVHGVVGLTEFPPGAAHSLHRHPGCHQMTLVLRGSGDHVTESRSHPQPVAHVARIPQGTVHGFKAGPAGATLLSIYSGLNDQRSPDFFVAEEEGAAALASPTSPVGRLGVGGSQLATELETYVGDLRQTGSRHELDPWADCVILCRAGTVELKDGDDRVVLEDEEFHRFAARAGREVVAVEGQATVIGIGRTR